LILPPGIFIVLLFLAAFYAKKYRKLFFTSAVLFYLLSTKTVSVFLAAPLEHHFAPVKQLPEKIDAVVVLGGGNYLGSPNLPLSEGSMKRFLYGIMLAKEYDLPLIFTGGWKDPEAVRQTVDELNHSLDLNLSMPQNFMHTFSLYIEGKSKNTHENALFTKTFLQQSGINNPHIALVTSAFHILRANMIFTKVGFNTLPAPTDYKAVYASHLNFLPSTDALKLSYLALHEYLGYLRYLFKN
jgi:uncharacterized SAM-binding protein YcdF (DUF218 family)